MICGWLEPDESVHYLSYAPPLVGEPTYYSCWTIIRLWFGDFQRFVTFRFFKSINFSQSFRESWELVVTGAKITSSGRCSGVWVWSDEITRRALEKVM
jgi:hypothetical protein